MSEMIERVARAMEDFTLSNANVRYVDWAKVAIAAMGEPTEAMRAAGRERYDFDDRLCDEAAENNKRYAGHVYAAMIEAALK